MLKEIDNVFSIFPAFQGVVPAGFSTDYIGSMIDGRFSDAQTSADVTEISLSLPNVDDEYFEWVSILRSVHEAKKDYTFVEVGSGYGRWSARAGIAARMVGLSPKCLLVEAEPQHAEWSREHLGRNGVIDFDIIQAAVAGRQGSTLFLVDNPSENSGGPQSWYGQFCDAWGTIPSRIDNKTYFGKPLLRNPNGWSGIEVPVVTLDMVLAGLESADLVDIDIQGMEAEVIESSEDVLQRKVRRVHIGTHNHEIEDRVRAVFQKLRWISEFDYSCHVVNNTTVGDILFDDGVQAWRNPSFGSASR